MFNVFSVACQTKHINVVAPRDRPNMTGYTFMALARVKNLRRNFKPLLAEHTQKH